MKLSKAWLNRYVSVSDLTDADLSHALTMVGFEVEGLETHGLPPLAHVVVGEILSYEQHPNADRLSVCQVDTGEGAPRTIVCGAKNFQAHDRVIVALPGAVLPGDFTIKESKLRGVLSQGMMCSERELGLGQDHAGIAILKDRPPVGTPVNEVYGPADTIFDVEVTPNRPDALSHLGMARELAAWFKRPLRYPEIKLNLPASAKELLVSSLTVEAPENCPHYLGYAVRGVTIGESPAWLKTHLTAIGLRPINNVVDVTNFVLHELGQPLHAFDVAKIAGRQIHVRPARAGETITTLDEKERRLEPGMTVIADAEKALVIAGVMGSVAAEVEATTRDIFLEAAYFNPSQVRKTSRALGLSTDSSYRFERGVDPQGTEFAARRCLDLIVEVAGGEVLGPPLVAGRPPVEETEIDLDPAFVRERLGFEIADADIVRHLDSLELRAREFHDSAGAKRYHVQIPSWRQDLSRPIDLVEEVLRLHGSDKIPTGEVRARGLLAEDDPVFTYLRKASAFLVGQGFGEVMHYTMRSETELRGWFGASQADALGLANPLASDASHLRTTLIPGLLDAMRLNQARGNPPQPYFETGRIFRAIEGQIFEYVSVCFLLPQEGAATWKATEKADFYTSSGLVQELFALAGVPAPAEAFAPIVDHPVWQNGHAARFGGHDVGYAGKFGLLNLQMAGAWDLEQPLLAGSVIFRPEFLKKAAARAPYTPLVLFPAATRDVALLVDQAVPAGKVLAHVRAVATASVGEGLSLEGVELFDLYAGQGLPEGKKSLAFSLSFRAPDRTLTDKEVQAVFDPIVKRLTEDPAYQLRG